MRTLILSLILILGLSVGALAQPDSEQPAIDDPNTQTVFEIVDPNVAILAASEYLPCYYPGNWVYFNHEVAYDLEGYPAAYIIIFRDPNSLIKTADDLRVSEKEHQQKIKDAELQVEMLNRLDTLDETSRQNIEGNIRKSLNKEKRASYHTNAFATVITGATEDSPIVYRCYIGLPGNFVREELTKEWLQKNYPDKKLRLQRLIFLSPLDVRFEVMPSGKPLQKMKKERMPVQIEIDEQAQLLSFSKEEPELEEFAIEKQKKQTLLQAKQQQIQEMPEEYRKKMEEGELNRKRDNAGKWREYQNEHSNRSSDSN